MTTISERDIRLFKWLMIFNIVIGMWNIVSWINNNHEITVNIKHEQPPAQLAPVKQEVREDIAEILEVPVPSEHMQEVADRQCLALTIYGEARAETAESMAAVAHAVMNRVKSSRYPDSVCDVVLQRYQYEPMASGTKLRQMAINARDIKSLDFPKMSNQWLKNKIFDIAHNVYDGNLPDKTKGATHFYAPKAQKALGRKPPHFASVYPLKATIGGHKFYRHVWL